MTLVPSPNGSRKTNGQFSTGNKFGRGNPHAQKVAQLRSAMIEAVTSEDIQAIMKALVENAKNGDIPSIKILLPYLVGSVPEPANPDEIELQEMYLESKYIDQTGYISRKREFAVK